MADNPELTASGWPRPVHNRWPVPWVSPKNDLANMDPDRVAEIKADHLCQVCGCGHAPDDTVYLVCNGALEGTSVTRDMSGLVVLSMDQSVLHERCARLSVALCPRLRKLKAEGHLIIISTLAKHVDLYESREGPTPSAQFVETQSYNNQVVEGEDQLGVEGQYATLVGDSL